MITCNSFCLCQGEGAGAYLSKNLGRVDRFRRTLLVNTGDGFKETNGEIPDGNLAVAALSLGKGLQDYPLVHGYVDDLSQMMKLKSALTGEFSYLTSGWGYFTAGRDLLGTRPLFVSEGPVRCVSSDHRFIDRSAEYKLVPAGTSLLQDGKTTTPRELQSPENLGALSGSTAYLSSLIEDAVRKRVAGHSKVAIAFSGGLDSSIIAYCASKYTSVILTSVFVKGASDEEFARRTAESLNMELISTRIDKDEALNELNSMELPFDPSPMDKSLWCIFSFASRTARDNGVELILLGQLADELFGGYLKYAKTLADKGEVEASQSMLDDINSMGSRGFLRDELACGRYLEPRFPFSDERIVSLALSMPLDFKIKEETRKFVLRRAAYQLGLPQDIAEIPKKAAQYSSGVLKLIS
jgi:asparagine synthase (glutamine-hydrolysing)